MSKQIVIADSTQIDTFLQCERLWNYEHVERLIPAGIKVSQAAVMGSLGHKLLDLYYTSLAMGESPEMAIEVALAFDIDTWFCTCNHSFDKHVVFCSEKGCECKEFISMRYDLPLPEREQVRQRFREYCYVYSIKTGLIPTSPKHIEIGFSHLIYEDSEAMFILEGRIDLIGSLSGMECIADHKFQLREKTLYKKSIQFRNYALVTNANLLIINMIRLAKTIGPKTFELVPVSFTSLEHKWWERELISIFKRMACAIRLASSNGGQMEPNWSSCSGRYGYECDYTRLCEPTEQDPWLIDTKKKTLYTIKPIWRPW